MVTVGYIRDAHGIRGEVYAVIPSKQWEWASVGVFVFGESRKHPENQFKLKVQKYKPHKEGLIIKFEEVPDRNHAEELKGFTLFLEEEHFVSQPGEPIFLREVLGFQVFDQGKELGEVVGFMDNGAHDLLKVKDASGKEHLVPFVEGFIDEILFEKKEVHMSLPEGLIEP